MNENRLGSKPSQVAEYVWAINQPLPPDHPNFVTTYVIEDKAGDLHLIDPGWDDEANWNSLKMALGALGRRPKDICSVTLTHQHRDHIGMAVQVRAESGCPIAMHHLDQEEILLDFASAMESNRIARLTEWAVPSSENAELLIEVQTQIPNIPPAFKADELVSQDDFLLILGRNLKVHHTPGHTPGHICIQDMDSKILFTGDHLIGDFNPGVGLGKIWRPDSMIDYLSALQRTENLPGVVGFSGHGKQIQDAAQRSQTIRQHHESRISTIRDQLADNKDLSVWDLAQTIQWSKPWQTLGPTMKRLILAQTAMYKYAATQMRNT